VHERELVFRLQGWEDYRYCPPYPKRRFLISSDWIARGCGIILMVLVMGGVNGGTSAEGY
jgi:hypothetical protein